jgi:hypothetical protein
VSSSAGGTVLKLIGAQDERGRKAQDVCHPAGRRATLSEDAARSSTRGESRG